MKIGIVGLGLIGGSLGRTIVARTDNTVYAFDLDSDAMRTGALLKAYHEVLSDENIGEMDLMIFALYPKALRIALKEYCPKLKDGCIVIDCCGNKRQVVDIMSKLSSTYPNLKFIGAHPMAGREFSGVKHSTATLYDKASMILVPVKADIRTLSLIKQFALEIGFGSVVITTADKHDEIIAYTSQLAHVVSSSYIKSPTAQQYLGFSAGSFRDMTRVARLSPEMWSQLMMENSDNLTREIAIMIEKLQEYSSALQKGDMEELKALLADGTEKKLSVERAKNAKINV
jgi:prephenate dehydrogenase